MKKSLTRILVALLCVCLVFSLFACGHKEPPSSDPIPSTESTVPTSDGSGSAEEDNTSDEATVPSDNTEPTGHVHEYEKEIVDPTCTAGGYTIYTCECGSEYIDDRTEKADHDYASNVVNPTCTSPGYTLYTCECGDQYKDDETPETGHKYGKWITTKEPTTTSTGIAERTCSVCGNVGTKILPKLEPPHEHDYTRKVVQPTCIEDGYTLYTCSCGDSYTSNRVAATGHSYGSWNLVTEPTCTANGSETRKCLNCDHAETREVEAIDHEYESVIVAPSCSEDGYTTHTCKNCGGEYKDTYINALGHNFGAYTSNNDATCTNDGTKTAKCARCDDTHTITDEGTAKGHSFGDWSTTTEPSCEATGEAKRTCSVCDADEFKIVAALGHDTVEHDEQAATCTEIGWESYVTCSRCDYSTYVEISALGHDEISHDKKDATCTEIGWDEYVTCSRCGYSTYKENAALGHDKITHEAKDATCENIGWDAYETCSRCDYSTYVEKSKLGHDEVSHEAQEPTCTEIGWNAYVTCKRCDYTTYTELAALGHSYGEWYSIKAPTCTETGMDNRECTLCGEIEEQVVATIDHACQLVITDPTCTEQGYSTFTCSCGYSEVSDYTDALGHSFTTYNSNNDATCTKDGTETSKCDRCDVTDTRNDEGSMLDHQFGDWAVVFAPTCTEDGQDRHVCTSCGFSETRVSNKLGHTLTEHEGKEPTCTEDGWADYETCSVCGHNTYKTLAAIGHNYESDVTEATCVSGGYTTHTCSRCQSSYVDTHVTPLGHDMSEWSVDKEPTCTDDGIEITTCSRCSHSETRAIDALGHEYSSVVTEPTCVDDGYTTNTCSTCGNSYVDNHTDAVGHKYGDWSISIQPECETLGEEKRICGSCGHSETRDVNAIGHSYSNDVTAPTCTEGGFTTHVCANCGDEYVDTYTEATGHSYKTVITPPTCTSEGFTNYTCANCDYSYVGDYVDAIPHNYEDVVTNPTCVSEGYTTHTCKCGESYVDSYVDKLPHEYVTIVTKPTCTSEGYSTHTCRNCGDNYVDTYVDKLPHTYTDTIVAPTCTTNGYTIHKCQCGDEYTDTIVDKIPHDYASEVVSPTCTDIGYTIYTCGCGETYNDDEVAALGHDMSEFATVDEATCTTKGSERSDCSRCDYFETRETDMIDHSYSSVVTAPTCTSEGYTTYTCACGDSYVADHTEKAAHSYVDEVIAPTCIAEGYTKHTCSVCGDTYNDATTAISDHSYGEWVTTLDPTAKTLGSAEHTCSVCGATETKEIPVIVLDERIVAYYKIVNGKVINLVSDSEMANAQIDGNYFYGGKVVLPASYPAYTIETIMLYNRESTENPISENFAYYGGALRFQEVTGLSNWNYIKTPFGGGQIWTDFVLRTSMNYNKRVFTNEDSYWAFAVDSEAGSYSVQVNDNYVNKSHWASANRTTFTLSSDHMFKEFIVYSEMLTEEELAEHFNDANINLAAESKTLIGRIADGISNLGSAFAFQKTGTNGIPEWLKTPTNAGSYSVDDGNGMTIDYTISDYIEPDLGIDNSKYESVHIIKKPETLYVDYKYALAAVPYPFNINHDGQADQYDVSWTSSDEAVATIIDGLIIPKKTGTVTITATLRGTSMSDSCTIQIVKKASVADRVMNISSGYVSGNGNSFSDTDYVMTTNAIYDAIDDAYFAGYNHVIFPQMDFYAAPTGTTYYVPTGMTIEFPEGSTFHMMPSDIAKSDGYTYFQFGGAWWSCGIPTNKYYTKTNANGDVLAYYCKDSHLIIDQYYGEFYKEGATIAELNTGANEYAWGCVLASFGKRAEYCSIEVREANCPTGFFILMGGKGNNELVNAAGGTIAADKFVSGWLDDTGTIVENGNWISTSDFYTVSPGAANGMDTLHQYYIGQWDHNVTVSTQHLYDILWFDENYELIQANRWQYVDEGYENKPSGAKYFKISIQQSDLPTGTDLYVGLYPDESTRFCEIKNTNIINGADGLASVVGATEACWIHDNYVSGDGLLSGSCWALDLEDGWQGMRGTVIERNILRKYAYSASAGEYRGPDSGILALSSGYNTFVISNYLGSIAQSNYNVANTHVINNVIYSMYSSFSSGTPNEIRTKGYGHVYYNILGQTSNTISANGVVYYYGNETDSTVNKW